MMGGGRREGDVEREIGKMEVERTMRRLKDGKAMGGDRIPNEVWKHEGEEVKEWAWRVCNRVWGGEGWPEEWKEGITVPIVKKGKGDTVGEYRGGDFNVNFI